jgi:chromosome segregation protein
VTREGDVFGAHFASGGSSSQPSLIEIQAAVDEAAAALAEATASGRAIGFEMSRLDAERLDAQKRVDVALAQLHESDATLAAVAEELGSTARRPARRAPRPTRLAHADPSRRGGPHPRPGRARGAGGPAHHGQEAPGRGAGHRRAQRLAEAGQGGPGWRDGGAPALRTAEERARALHGRADSLLRNAAAERESRARPPRAASG